MRDASNIINKHHRLTFCEKWWDQQPTPLLLGTKISRSKGVNRESLWSSGLHTKPFNYILDSIIVITSSLSRRKRCWKIMLSDKSGNGSWCGWRLSKSGAIDGSQKPTKWKARKPVRWKVGKPMKWKAGKLVRWKARKPTRWKDGKSARWKGGGWK